MLNINVKEMFDNTGILKEIFKMHLKEKKKKEKK